MRAPNVGLLTLTRLSAATLTIVALSLPARADGPVTRVEVGVRVSEAIPDVPESLVARLARYQNTRGAILGGFAGNDAVIVLTRFGETNQAHRVTAPLGMREQLTFFKEPVSAVAVQPGKASRGFVFGRDVGGSEFWQLYWFDFASRETVLLTTPEVRDADGKPARRTRNEYPLWSGDGKQLAWASTARNGTDSDIWVADMQAVTAGGQAAPPARAVLTEGGTWLAADFSPDGKRLLVIKFVSINEAYPGEVDLETGTLRLFPVDGGKASFTAFKYAPDGRGVYYVSDEGRDFLTLWYHDPKGGAPVAISKDIPWDVDELALSPTGRHLAFTVNDDGVSKLHVRTLPGL
ncbi:MAG: PD40 domain-containing protein, partial [Myxococcales bacterium]|nr:PD40 domain-containing protein [Myxococcales bacterium]